MTESTNPIQPRIIYELGLNWVQYGVQYAKDLMRALTSLDHAGVPFAFKFQYIDNSQYHENGNGLSVTDMMHFPPQYQVETLMQHTRDNGWLVGCTVYDAREVEWVLGEYPDFIKIASPDALDYNMWKTYFANTRCPKFIYVSCGQLSNLEDWQTIVNEFFSRQDMTVILNHCTSQYPQIGVGFRRFLELQRTINDHQEHSGIPEVKLGYSHHANIVTEGLLELLPLVDTVEVHVHPNESYPRFPENSVDHAVSLTPSQIVPLLDAIRKADEPWTTQSPPFCLRSEAHSRELRPGERTWVALQDIRPNERVSPTNARLLRNVPPDGHGKIRHGCDQDMMDHVAIRLIERGSIIIQEDLKP